MNKRATVDLRVLGILLVIIIINTLAVIFLLGDIQDSIERVAVQVATREAATPGPD